MSRFAQSPCYETAIPSSPGINFHLTPSRQIYISYAWLLSVELIDDSEVVFSFNSAKIRVIGGNLAPIYQAAIDANLSCIIPQRQESTSKTTWIAQVVLENNTSDSTDQPLPYPHQIARER